MQAQFSPDGRWVAYSSDRTGRREVYISSFPKATEQIPISNNGGAAPRWRRDGKELFYFSSDQKVMAVDIGNGQTLKPGVPRELFPARITGGFFVTGVRWDAAPDGQKFLINTPLGEASSPSITLVQNWALGLKR